jgi:hypothetical protein
MLLVYKKKDSREKQEQIKYRTGTDTRNPFL